MEEGSLSWLNRISGLLMKECLTKVDAQSLASFSTKMALFIWVRWRISRGKALESISKSQENALKESLPMIRQLVQHRYSTQTADTTSGISLISKRRDKAASISLRHTTFSNKRGRRRGSRTLSRRMKMKNQQRQYIRSLSSLTLWRMPFTIKEILLKIAWKAKGSSSSRTAEFLVDNSRTIKQMDQGSF